jgi:hypothetical protein
VSLAVNPPIEAGKNLTELFAKQLLFFQPPGPATRVYFCREDVPSRPAPVFWRYAIDLSGYSIPITVYHGKAQLLAAHQQVKTVRAGPDLRPTLSAHQGAAIATPQAEIRSHG